MKLPPARYSIYQADHEDRRFEMQGSGPMCMPSGKHRGEESVMMLAIPFDARFPFEPGDHVKVVITTELAADVIYMDGIVIDPSATLESRILIETATRCDHPRIQTH